MPNGYTKIAKDCNKSTGSEWDIFVCYKKDSSKSPIRQIQSTVIKDERSNGESQGEWSMVTGREGSDMNKGASGKYIYLYYNRSE